MSIIDPTLLVIVFLLVLSYPVLKKALKKGGKKMLIIGIAIAIIGILIFVEREFFIGIFVDSYSDIKEKSQVLAVFGGLVFFLGVFFTIKGSISNKETTKHSENEIFCSKFGKKLDIKSSFCPYCGENIKK